MHINSSAPNFNGAVSGLISLAVDAGLPVDLTLPISLPFLNLPIDDNRRQASGKVPCVLDAKEEWVGIEGWESEPIRLEVLQQMNRSSCNVGMVTGRPNQDGNLHVLAIDVASYPGHKADTDAILAALQPHLGGDQFIHRVAHPDRATCLVNLTSMLGSRKMKWLVSRGGVEVGKIELLGTGQQTVVAGIHWTGNRIVWHCASEPGQTYAVPPLNRFQLASYEDQSAVAAMLESVWQSLKGYEFALAAAGNGAGEASKDEDKAPTWFTVDILVGLIERMHNGQSVVRERYESIANQIAAARRGIKAHRGISEEGEERIAKAFAGWASKYIPTGRGDNAMPPSEAERYETELTKWRNDWIKGGDTTDWKWLVASAQSLGLPDLPNEMAQHDFTAGEKPSRFSVKCSQDGIPAGDWYVADASGERAYEFSTRRYATEDEALLAIEAYEADQSALPGFLQRSCPSSWCKFVMLRRHSSAGRRRWNCVWCDGRHR